jgi:hypothetical protein
LNRVLNELLEYLLQESPGVGRPGAIETAAIGTRAGSASSNLLKKVGSAGNR